MPPVKTEVKGCSVHFSWEDQKDDGGSPVLKYMIQIKQDSGQNITVKKCGNLWGVFECNLPMELLMNEPYNLKLGDDISNRVTVSAYNALGWSQPSPLDKTIPRVKVLTWPKEVSNLKVQNQNENSVTL